MFMLKTSSNQLVSDKQTIMKIVLFLIPFLATGLFSNCENPTNQLSPRDPIQFSQDYLMALKTGKPHEKYSDTLATIDVAKLAEELNTVEKQLAFWINTYNALVQQKIKEDTSTYRDASIFFKERNLEIGGQFISLDDLENGILRGKTVNKVGCRACRGTGFIEQFRLEKIEPRIHFALNCGATSCPPIAFYSDKELNAQLTLAEASFVQSSSIYTPETNTLEINEIFKWFEDDFGGKKGILELMVRYEILPKDISSRIIYTPYDWSLTLENW